MDHFILILLTLNIVHCLTNVNIVSDLVDPLEYCYEKKECIDIGIDGDVDCIKTCCSCVNNTKYKKHIRGCFKNVAFEDVCNVTAECLTPGSICEYTNCGKDSYKRCVCKNDAELISGSCQRIRDKLSRKCCTNIDCKVENMFCNTETQKCECEQNFLYFNNSCVSHIDMNICQEDENCTHMPNSKCSKINNSVFKKCQCEPNFHIFNNTCVSHNICSDNKQCGINQNCYLLSDSKYGICYEGLICKNGEIIIDNQCISIEEKLCKSNLDCNDTEICYLISNNNTGICIREPKYNKYNELLSDEENGNLTVSNKINKTDTIKEAFSKHCKNNATNIKNKQLKINFIYLGGILFSILYYFELN